MAASNTTKIGGVRARASSPNATSAIAASHRSWIALVHTGLYHRDPEGFGAAADRFAPEERVAAKKPNGRSVTSSDPPLYVFSDHRQSCAGQFLVIFLLKAVLAHLLAQDKFVLADRAVAIDPVPAAIDHFAIRFWRR